VIGHGYAKAKRATSVPLSGAGLSFDPIHTVTLRYSVLWLLFLSCAAAVPAYFRMFTGFSAWDDEGTLMISVRFYLAGYRLYDEVFSGYGPVYYIYNAIVRNLSGAALDHDSVRITSVVLMVTCPFLSAWIVLRLTESVLVASLAHILSFVFLRFFNNEPGHPQELVILLLLGLNASSLLASRAGRAWIAMILVGATTAGLALIKINIGIFMVLAVALAVWSRSPATIPTRIAGIAGAAAALILPSALMLNHFEDNLARLYCLVVTISVANLIVGLIDAGKTISLSGRDCWIALASFVVLLVTVLLVMMLQGVSAYGLLYSNVFIHLKMNILGSLWYHPLILRWIWAPWAFGGLLVAIVISRSARRAHQFIAVVKLVFGAGALLLAAGPNSNHLVGFLAPYAWLVLYAPSEEAGRREGFSRSLLAATTVLQTLYAYPIAGSQAFFIKVLLVVVAAVCVGDFLRAVETAKMPAALRPLIRTAVIAILSSVLLAYVDYASVNFRAYEKGVPLGLPGAERIHVPRQQAQDYHWLTNTLKSHCDVFIGMPDLPSLYFWTGMQPATMLNADNWMLSINDEQQEAIISALSSHPDACVFFNPDLFDFWIRGPMDTDKFPLAHYIHQNFKSVAVRDNYFFMVRRERDLTVSIDLEPQ
jgi:hypothetical protein